MYSFRDDLSNMTGASTSGSVSARLRGNVLSPEYDRNCLFTLEAALKYQLAKSCLPVDIDEYLMDSNKGAPIP